MIHSIKINIVLFDIIEKKCYKSLMSYKENTQFFISKGTSFYNLKKLK